MAGTELQGTGRPDDSHNEGGVPIIKTTTTASNISCVACMQAGLWCDRYRPPPPHPPSHAASRAPSWV
jgi:hypothetical protein